MSDSEKNGTAGNENISSVFTDEDRKLRELAKMYENMPLTERIRKTLNGLSAPKDSGEYKFAKLQLQRSIGPILAILLPLAGIGGLLSMQKTVDLRERTQQVEILEVEDAPEMEETPDTPEEMEALDPIDIDIDGPTTDQNFETPVEVTDAPVSPKPAEMNSVAQIDSPIVLKGIIGSRNPGQRGAALSRWGVGAGDAIVMRALRWLKMQQNKDGSWNSGGYATAATSLALLTYLAHGETPNDSPEFGETVGRALQFLVNTQDKSTGLFKFKDGNNYSHPIAVYALSEAFSMTRNPMVKEAAEAALVPLIKGQYKNGSWAYNMKGPEVNKSYPVGDSSYAGWCAQAIKAAHTAELDVPGLEECYNKAKHGFDDLYYKKGEREGGFGYNSPGRKGLSAVGTLCMQLLGEYNDPKVLKTMEFMSNCTYDFSTWENQPWGGGNGSPVYYWYYLTQCKFQTGGDTFKAWNMKFYPELDKRQIVIQKESSGYTDDQGYAHPIGYWDSPSEDEHGGGGSKVPCKRWKNGKEIAGETTTGRRIQDTCLSALQLMVYYRFLPASQAVNPAVGGQTGAEKKKKKSGEVSVGIRKKPQA